MTIMGLVLIGVGILIMYSAYMGTGWADPLKKAVGG